MPTESTGPLLACHECDALHQLARPLQRREVAYCGCCNSLLSRHTTVNAVQRSLALHISALMLFIIANAFPFITLKLSGREETDLIVSGPVALFSIGSMDIALLILLTTIIAPLISMLGTIYLLIPAHFNKQAAAAGAVFRLLGHIRPWSMVGVFMLGVIIAVVKLLDLAQLEFGIALAAYIIMMPVIIMAEQQFNSTLIWPTTPRQSLNRSISHRVTAREHHLMHCHTCSAITPDNASTSHCQQCGSTLHTRKPDSINRSWALLLTGMMLFIPANLFPIMTVIQFGQGEPSTIIGGVIHLIHAGMWPLGMIVFFASIMVPVSKFAAMIFLLLSLRSQSAWRPEDRTRLYRVIERIGSWSMVDIFVIGLLTSLVNLGSIATIEPGIAASFFGATVVFTMLATHSFDPRLIWDSAMQDKQQNSVQQEHTHG